MDRRPGIVRRPSLSQPQPASARLSSAGGRRDDNDDSHRYNERGTAAAVPTRSSLTSSMYHSTYNHDTNSADYQRNASGAGFAPSALRPSSEALDGRLPSIYGGSSGGGGGAAGSTTVGAVLGNQPKMLSHGPATQVVRRRVPYPSNADGAAGTFFIMASPAASGGTGISNPVRILTPPHPSHLGNEASVGQEDDNARNDDKATTSSPPGSPQHRVSAMTSGGSTSGSASANGDVARRWRRLRQETSSGNPTESTSSATHSGSFASSGPMPQPTRSRSFAGRDDTHSRCSGDGASGASAVVRGAPLVRSAGAAPPLHHVARPSSPLTDTARCAASFDRHSSNVSGSAVIASRHGRRASLPRLVDSSADGVTAAATGGAAAPLGAGASRPGSYSLRGGSSVGSHRTVSMHSLATRQKKDDNFDFGLDALGIPTGELRSNSVRTGVASTGSGAGLLSLRSSSVSGSHASGSGSGGAGSRCILPPCDQHCGTTSSGSVIGVDAAASPMGDDSAIRSSRGGDSAITAPSGITAANGSARAGTATSKAVAATAPTQSSSYNASPPVLSSSSLQRQMDNRSLSTVQPAPPTRVPPATPSRKSALLLTGRKGGGDVSTQAMAPTAAAPAASGVSPVETNDTATRERSRESGQVDTSSQAILLRSTTLTARRVDTDTEHWRDAGYDFGTAMDGTPLVAANRLQGLYWQQHTAAGAAVSAVEDSELLYGRDESYRCLFGIDRDEDDEDDSAATEAGYGLSVLSRHGATSMTTATRTPESADGASASRHSIVSSCDSAVHDGDNTNTSSSDTSSNGTVSGWASEGLRTAVSPPDPRPAQQPGQHRQTSSFATSEQLGNISAYFPLASSVSVSASAAGGGGAGGGAMDLGNSGPYADFHSYTPGDYYLYSYNTGNLTTSTGVDSHRGTLSGLLASVSPSGAGGVTGFRPQAVAASLRAINGGGAGLGSLSGVPSPASSSVAASASRSPRQFADTSAFGSTRSHAAAAAAAGRRRRGSGGGATAQVPPLMGDLISGDCFNVNATRSLYVTSVSPTTSSSLAGPSSVLSSSLLQPHSPRTYHNECGHVLEGVELWERPLTRLPPPAPANAAATSATAAAASRGGGPLSSGAAWEAALGLVVIETPRNTSRNGAQPQREPSVALNGYRVVVRAGDLQGSCTVDECVGRTQGSAALPSDLLSSAQRRFRIAGENAFVVLMDRVNTPSAVNAAASTNTVSVASRNGVYTTAGDRAVPSPISAFVPDSVHLLPAILSGVLRETARANAQDVASARVDLRLALAFLPRTASEARKNVVVSSAASLSGGAATLDHTFVELIEEGPATAQQPARQQLEVASSPLFGPCINGCQWLLVESEADIDNAVHRATELLARMNYSGSLPVSLSTNATATLSPPRGRAQQGAVLARAGSEGVIWAQFLLQRRTSSDVLVSTFTVAATADAALFEGVLDQRAGSPWPLFRNALGKGPCMVLAVASLRETDTEAVYPLAVLQRMLEMPHPPPQAGSVAAYVALLKRRQGELERARAETAATDGDEKRFAMRLEKVMANLADARAFLEKPCAGTVPIYVDVAPRPCASTVTTTSSPTAGREAGTAAASDSAKRGGNAAREVPAHRLPAASVATVVLVRNEAKTTVGRPSASASLSSSAPSLFTWRPDERTLTVAAPASASSSSASGRAQPPSTGPAVFAVSEFVRVPAERDWAATVSSVAALRSIEEEFRSGFNSFGVFLHAGGSGDAGVSVHAGTSGAASTLSPSLAATTSFAEFVVQRVLSRPLLAHAKRAQARMAAASASRSAAEVEAQQQLRLQPMKDKGLVLRLSASLYAVRGDTVVDLFAFGEDVGDAAPSSGSRNHAGDTLAPAELVLARSPLLGLSPSGVVQRNIRSFAQFHERLAMGLERLARLKRADAAAAEAGNTTTTTATEPRVLVLSLQLKQQDPTTCDVVVSNLSLLSLGQQAALLSDRTTRRMSSAGGGYGGSRRQTAPRSSSSNGSGSGTVPYACVYTLLADTLRGSGHCTCVAIVPDTPAAARRVLAVMQRVSHAGRRLGSQRVQLGSVARLLLRMRHLRAQVQRGRGRALGRGNTERIDKVVFDAEQLLYHPDEHEPRYYARTADSAVVGGRIDALTSGSGTALVAGAAATDESASATSRRIPAPRSAPGPDSPYRAPDGSTRVAIETDEDDDEAVFRDTAAPDPVVCTTTTMGSLANANSSTTGTVTTATNRGAATASSVSGRSSSASASASYTHAPSTLPSVAPVATAAGPAANDSSSGTSAPARGLPGPGQYYGTRFERDPPLLRPQQGNTAAGLETRSSSTARARQMQVPALVVVSASAAGETGATSIPDTDPGCNCASSNANSSSGGAGVGGFVIDVKGHHRVGVRRASAAEGSTSLSGCEADEVVEIRTASSSMKSVNLAHTLSCVVSGRTAAILALDTAAPTDAGAVSWLLVRTAVTALFASLDDAAIPYLISLRAFAVGDRQPLAVDLLRHIAEPDEAALLDRARAAMAAAGSGAGVAAGSGAGEGSGMGGTPSPPTITRADAGGRNWSSAGRDAPFLSGLRSGGTTSPSSYGGEAAPILSRVRFSPMCGPTYGFATVLAVESSQHFDALLGRTLWFGGAAFTGFHSTDSTNRASGNRNSSHNNHSSSNHGVVLELSVHQFLAGSDDVVISSLWCVVADSPLMRRESGGALAATYLPFFLGGPCYTTAVLGLTQAPEPMVMDKLGTALRTLRDVGLSRPRHGSVRAYEAFLYRCLVALRASEGTSGDERATATAGGANADDDKNATLPRLTAMLNEARALRMRAPGSYQQSGKLPGLLAHEAKFFRPFDN